MKLRPYTTLCRGTLYALADHPFILERREREWYVRPEGPGSLEWMERNQPDLPQACFPTRRAALQLLEALHAVDPLPVLPVLPASALRRQKDGTYLLTDAEGTTYRIARYDNALNNPYKWMASFTGDKGEYSLGPYQTLTEVRAHLARR